MQGIYFFQLEEEQEDKEEKQEIKKYLFLNK